MRMEANMGLKEAKNAVEAHDAWAIRRAQGQL
jgi:ribosomal protein L7/L12